MKRILIPILILAIILLPASVYSAPTITFTQTPNAHFTFTVNTGIAEEPVTFLAAESNSTDFNTLRAEQVRWIYQAETDGTGKATCEFRVDPTNTDQTWLLGSGSSSGLVTKSVYIPRYQPDVSDIPDNYIRIGNDVYSMNSPALTNSAILDSLRDGGNHVYYKVNGRWYNVLADQATSSAFFTNTNNAENEGSVNNWSLVKYYYNTDPRPYNFIQ